MNIGLWALHTGSQFRAQGLMIPNWYYVSNRSVLDILRVEAVCTKHYMWRGGIIQLLHMAFFPTNPTLEPRRNPNIPYDNLASGIRHGPYNTIPNFLKAHYLQGHLRDIIDPQISD